MKFGIGDPVLQIATAPYESVPLELGYWSDRGLNVEPVPTQGATATLQLLSAGQVDIANGGTTSIYSAAASDPDIRIISMMRGNIWQTVVMPDSEITSLENLKGKTIGAQSLSSAAYLFGRAALAASGVDPENDVEWLPVGVGTQAAEALKSGDIAAYATYGGPMGVVDNLIEGDLKVLPTPLEEIIGTAGVATTQQYLDEHPDEVIDFLCGYYKGAMLGMEAPECAVQIHWSRHPEQKPDLPADRAMEETLAIALDRFDSTAARSPDGEIGFVTEEEAQGAADFFYENGLLEEAIDAGEYLDMGPTLEAQNFDTEAVLKDATDCAL